MIDIKLINEEFNNYVSNFNPNEGRIKLKIDHIKRVSKKCSEIAQNLKLNENEIKLAETIGLFHDIGRFEQAKTFNTFSDKDSVNHAELSIKVLFEENLIKNFKIDKKYYNIIKVAILNHNKNKIEDGLTEEELLYSKIIRDADKLDIYYTICNYDFESIFWYQNFDCNKISDILMQQFINSHAINYADIKSNADQILIFYAYIYDFYYDFSLQYLKRKRYINIFTDRVIKYFSNKNIEKQVLHILEICNNYLKKY